MGGTREAFYKNNCNPNNKKLKKKEQCKKMFKSEHSNWGNAMP
jgi:hypothetical protein